MLPPARSMSLMSSYPMHDAWSAVEGSLSWSRGGHPAAVIALGKPVAQGVLVPRNGAPRDSGIPSPLRS